MFINGKYIRNEDIRDKLISIMRLNYIKINDRAIKRLDCNPCKETMFD